MKNVKSLALFNVLALIITWSACTPPSEPIADFDSSLKEINMGETVDFFDQSTNEPQSYLWTFEGATPSSSTDQNPTEIQYKNAGKYTVTLVVSNSAGNNTITKTDYIKVVNPLAPVADFTASDTTILEEMYVNFTDLTTKSPTEWEWTFEGGEPATSTEQNPQRIVYNSPGVYTVTLKAANSDASATTTKTGYVTVSKSPYRNIPVASKALLLMASATEVPPSGTWGWELFDEIISSSSEKMIPFKHHSKIVFGQDLVNIEGDSLDRHIKTDGWPTFYVGGNNAFFKELEIGLGKTEEQLKQELEALIDNVVVDNPLAIAASTWRVNNNKIEVESYVGFTKETEGEYFVAIWVSEDKVNSPQAGRSENNPEHRFVLRTACDDHNVFGIPLNTESSKIQAKEAFSNKHYADFPESEWDKNNITVSVVVFEKKKWRYYPVNVSSAEYSE
jgi:PKD repeat protein